MKKIKYIIPLIISLVVVLFLMFYQTANQCNKKGIKLANEGKIEEAISMFEKAIEKKPKFTQALINCGYYKLQLLKYDAALLDFEKVLEYDKKNTLALYNIGCIKNEVKDYKSALYFFDKSLETKGGAYITMDYVSTSYMYNPNAEFDVSTNEIRFNRGISLYYLKNFSEAHREFSTCANDNYLPEESYYNIAQICFLCNKITEGCIALNQSMMNGKKDIPEEYLQKCGIK